jgi:hypothetical protein
MAIHKLFPHLLIVHNAHALHELDSSLPANFSVETSRCCGVQWTNRDKWFVNVSFSTETSLSGGTLVL